MSFQIKLDKYQSAYGRLVRRVQSAIQETFAQEAEAGMTQADIARELELDASVVSRRLNGSGNATLRSISDLYVAMGREPLANFESLEPSDLHQHALNSNHPLMQSLPSNFASNQRVTVVVYSLQGGIPDVTGKASVDVNREMLTVVNDHSLYPEFDTVNTELVV